MRRTFLVLMTVVIMVGLTGCPAPVPPVDDGDNGGDGTDTAKVTFGAVQPPAEEVEARPQAINPFAANSNVELPKSADLTKDLPAIGDQGAIGSCTAWAAGYGAATYTAERQYQWGATLADHQASPGYLYERLLEEDNLQCGGGTLISTAMNLLVREGCSSFAVVGYSDQTCTPNPSAADAHNFRVGSYNRVVETDRHAVRAELAAGRVIVFGTRLYDDFTEATGSGVYTGSGNFLMQGEMHAAHAMALVGYDDDHNAYRIMNSWSTQWGDSGFLWMAYDTFHDTVFEVYSIEPAGDREPPSPPGPGPGPDPEPGPDPDLDGFITEAYQFVDTDPITRNLQTYLVFFYHFEAPVFISTVTIFDPVDASAAQDWNTWSVDGYVYLVQPGELQFLSGEYTLLLGAMTVDDESVTLSQTVFIDSLDSDGDGEGLCSDFCMFAYDGECDDGGPGSQFSVCEYGTDCFDCDERDPQGGGGGSTELCTNSCRFAGDGECDDGGPGAMYGACELGSDCTDCGARNIDDDFFDVFCTDSCMFAFDGECDDGGPGAMYAVCEFGTDCFDCDPRTLDDIDDGLGDLELCTDFCPFAFDGQCDDGGPGAMFAVCELGSDCFDCGPRGQEICLDTCASALDGECDDGGVGALFAVCEFGTDCNDCGARNMGDSGAVDGKTVQRMFRGIPVKTPAKARSLPVAGLQSGVLGANRQPARVVPAATSQPPSKEQ